MNKSLQPLPSNGTPEGKLQRNVRVGTLCAFYGGLLTQRQREALQLHYDEDLSLGEIAEQFEVSRQNIHDLINRSVQKLQRYEDAVGGIAQAQRMGERLRIVQRLLQKVCAHQNALQYERDIQSAMVLIAQTLTEIDGEVAEENGL